MLTRRRRISKWRASIWNIWIRYLFFLEWDFDEILLCDLMWMYCDFGNFFWCLWVFFWLELVFLFVAVFGWLSTFFWLNILNYCCDWVCNGNWNVLWMCWVLSVWEFLSFLLKYCELYFCLCVNLSFCFELAIARRFSWELYFVMNWESCCLGSVW